MVELFEMDKQLIISGGFVPKDIAHCISQQQYMTICKEMQAINLDSQNKACCIEYGCCCIGLYLVTCIHEPIANALFERAMSRKFVELNHNLFGQSVLSSRGSGRQLKFVFNTAHLTPFPVVAEPIPPTPPPSSSQYMANNVLNPTFSPMMNPNMMVYNPVMAPMGGPNVYGVAPPTFADPAAQLAYNNQMAAMHQQMLLNNQMMMMSNPALYNQMMANQHMMMSNPTMYNQMMFNQQMMMTLPGQGVQGQEQGMEMTDRGAPIAVPISPVPVPQITVPLVVGTQVTGPH